MARRGAKPKPDAMKLVRGTFERARARTPVVPDLEGTPEAPKWLKGTGLRIFKERLAVYEARGQSVVGKENTLAQYCAVEASLIEMWKRKAPVVVTLINQHRIYANEFYDTPASQQGPVAKAAGNKFAGNGQRPGRTA